ncbi:hypothetical protein CL628_00265 [bacterium]|nr:hypothetical protein [bacterium]
MSTLGISFARITRTAFVNFWRNIWLSVATMVIMIITLLMISFLYFANVFGSEVLQTIEQKVDLSVTFKEDVQDQYITTIADELKLRDDIADVRVISSDRALEIFRARHADDPLIEESLQELEDNPLPANLFIVATDPQHYANIAKHLEAEKYSPFIDQVDFENTETERVVEKLIAYTTSVKNGALVVTGLFSLLVVLIMFNTLRLAIYSFREEIDIMRLVGASRWFVQGPFIIEAILVALVAVVISSAISFATLRAISPTLSTYFFDVQQSPFSIYDYAVTNIESVIGLQVVLAVGLAGISSLVAVRRYLRN